MSGATMRAARLHGLEDLRIDQLEVPAPAAGELLVRIEANGVCATDARKYRVGVNDGTYPFNPGHEWVGRVEAVGPEVSGWSIGDRVYGDTYGGYAEFTTIPVDPGPWSCGPTRLPHDVPVERAVFLEPLADCLHAVTDQAQVRDGQRVVVVAAGSMGLQMIAVSTRAGAHVVAVEPQAERRELARAFGAAEDLEPEGWVDVVREDGGADAVIVCAGDPDLVAPAVAACATGGRVVLFAGFGDRPVVPVDVNDLHYREIALVGSEWIGSPPNQRRERYDEAARLLASGELRLEQLVTARCSFDDLEAALIGRSAFRVLKTVFVVTQEAPA
ncbi:MAG TPA: zinc-binding dehydrogenase [Actinomycetota bacterium]|nr:zinc-binding dehydrogenase [Actinomycetota bacterium]